MIKAVIDTNVIVSALSPRIWKRLLPKKPIVVTPAEMLEILRSEEVI